MLKKALLIVTATLFLGSGRANAAEVKILVGGAMTDPVKKVGAEFSRKTSNKLDFITDISVALQKRLAAGEKADVVVVNAATMDVLEKEKLVFPGSRVDLARGLIGVCVRAGASPVDVSSVDAFKKAMLSARSVSYVDPKAGATSGIHTAGLFEKMGIAVEMLKKTVLQNQGSEVAAAVAKGDAEIGINFISEMISNKGVKVVGTLPATIQLPTNYAAAIPTGAPNPDAGRAFLQALQAPAGQAAIKEAGLEPIQGR